MIIYSLFIFIITLESFFLLFNVKIRNGKQIYCGELWDPKKLQYISPDIKYYDQNVDDWFDFDRDADECIATLKVLKLGVKETQLLNEDENCQDSDMPPSPTKPSTPCRSGTPSINSRHQTPVSRLQTLISRPHTHVDRPQTPSSRAETSSRPDTCQSPGGGDLTLPSLSRQDTPSTLGRYIAL